MTVGIPDTSCLFDELRIWIGEHRIYNTDITNEQNRKYRILYGWSDLVKFVKT